MSPFQQGSSSSTAPSSPGGRLRSLLAEDGLVTAPGVFDGLSAQLVAGRTASCSFEVFMNASKGAR